MTALTRVRIVSTSHPDTFGWLIGQPPARGEVMTLTLEADLPALRLCAGDVLTVERVPGGLYDALYLLHGGELARIALCDAPGRKRVVRQDGRIEVLAIDAIRPSLAGVVTEIRDRHGRRAEARA